MYRKYSGRGDADLVPAIASTICKMLRCRLTPFATPFNRMEQRTLLKFTKGQKRASFWTRLVVAPKYPKKYLSAVHNRGAMEQKAESG
jgi:hypothetical protein